MRPHGGTTEHRVGGTGEGTSRVGERCVIRTERLEKMYSAKVNLIVYGEGGGNSVKDAGRVL